VDEELVFSEYLVFLPIPEAGWAIYFGFALVGNKDFELGFWTAPETPLPVV
jgi:hypothetical protein